MSSSERQFCSSCVCPQSCAASQSCCRRDQGEIRSVDESTTQGLACAVQPGAGGRSSKDAPRPVSPLSLSAAFRINYAGAPQAPPGFNLAQDEGGRLGALNELLSRSPAFKPGFEASVSPDRVRAMVARAAKAPCGAAPSGAFSSTSPALSSDGAGFFSGGDND